MKVSLVVQNAGKMTGQTIPINLAQFIIGRDPQCNLRPASAVISKRHCAFLVRDNQVYLKDFDSTNGTFLNEQPVKGEVPVSTGDIFRVGPLNFKVVIEPTSAPVDKPTPLPPIKPATPVPPAKAGATKAAATKAAAKAGGKPNSDEDIAALLLGLDDGGEEGAADESDIPSGSTVMDMVPLPPAAQGEGEKKPGTPAPPPKKDEKKDPAHVAAAALLQKMSRRPRT